MKPEAERLKRKVSDADIFFSKILRQAYFTRLVQDPNFEQHDIDTEQVILHFIPTNTIRKIIERYPDVMYHDGLPLIVSGERSGEPTKLPDYLNGISNVPVGIQMRSADNGSRIIASCDLKRTNPIEYQLTVMVFRPGFMHYFIDDGRKESPSGTQNPQS